MKYASCSIFSGLRCFHESDEWECDSSSTTHMRYRRYRYLEPRACSDVGLQAFFLDPVSSVMAVQSRNLWDGLFVWIQTNKHLHHCHRDFGNCIEEVTLYLWCKNYWMTGSGERKKNQTWIISILTTTKISQNSGPGVWCGDQGMKDVRVNDMLLISKDINHWIREEHSTHLSLYHFQCHELGLGRGGMTFPCQTSISLLISHEKEYFWSRDICLTPSIGGERKLFDLAPSSWTVIWQIRRWDMWWGMRRVLRQISTGPFVFHSS